LLSLDSGKVFLSKDVCEVDVNFIEIGISGGRRSRSGGVSVGSRAWATESTSLRAVGGSVALFTLVLDTITASWESAVSSTSVGCEVGVGGSSVAFFVSFNNTISAFGSDFKEVDWSSVSGLEASGVVALNTSELGQLAGRDWHRGGEDEPVGIFTARRCGVGTRVVVGSWGGWENSSGVDGGVQVD